MNKTEFYKSRILWKAKKYKLFEKKCKFFQDLDDEQQSTVKFFSPKGEEVLVFWNGEDLWTVLTTEEVLSFHDGALFRMNLDDIQQKIEVILDAESKTPKRSAEFLLLGDEKIKIWGFAGEELISLYNTLRMFPLKHNEI